jgi:hypothetical protein
MVKIVQDIWNMPIKTGLKHNTVKCEKYYLSKVVAMRTPSETSPPGIMRSGLMSLAGDGNLLSEGWVFTDSNGCIANWTNKALVGNTRLSRP